MYRRLLTFPGWIVLSALGSVLLASGVLLLHRGGLPASSQMNDSSLKPASDSVPAEPELGPRHQLTYEQWLDLLRREARVAAEQRPNNLTILAGDSLSLWFPQDLLPAGYTWLNQGISGEISYGLRRRLRFFDRTQPEAIFVMIGINDLIRGVREATLLANLRGIIRHLKTAHPMTRIVVQSILPHGDGLLLHKQSRNALKQNRKPPAWVNRLYHLPNSYIRELNEKLVKITKDEEVEYLDLHSYFTNSEGDLLPELTTDGLHLSLQGYRVWQARLKAFNQTISDTKSSGRSPRQVQTSLGK